MGLFPRRPFTATLLLVAGLVLSGCQETREPTASVTLGPPLPPTSTPAATSAPLPTLPPTPVPVPSPTPEATGRPQEGVALTVLHTNDVNGHIDPCG